MQENEIENVCEMLTILSQPQCINAQCIHFKEHDIPETWSLICQDANLP